MTMTMKRTSTAEETMVKVKRKRLRASHQLSKEKVDEMWEAYLEEQSATYVANQCGVNFRTARRYIREGDDTRNMPSFQDRLNKIEDGARKKADAEVEKERVKTLKAVQDYEDRMIEALSQLKMDPDDISARDLDILARLKQFLLGQAESRHGPDDDGTDGEVVSSKFTPEQLQTMAEALLDAEEREQKRDDADEG
jgi:hypothetical protein